MTPNMSTREWSVSKRWRRLAGVAGIGIVGLAVMLPITRPTQAQEAPEAPVVGAVLETIAPTATLTVEPAERRSVANMPEAGLDLMAGETPLQPRRLSDLPPSVYKAMKEQAARSAEGVRGPMAPGALAPPLLRLINFEGVNQTVACNCIPPDPHGAIGRTHFVQVTNSHLDIYTNVAVPVKVKSVTLNAFFGEANFLFDPRAVYDPIWNRWIIVATRASTSAGDPVRKFRLAVSTTSNPTGSFFLYNVNFAGGGTGIGDFWDYPQLGFDQDAVFITGNIFTFAGAFRTTAMMPIAKARLYNGLGFGVPLFTTGLVPTLAPPIVQDQNANAYFVAANTSGRLHLYRGTNLSNPTNATMVLQAQVVVPAYSAPPDAAQPGTAVLLDTLDRRFVNASSQVGDSLWNVHSIAVGPSTPKFYQIDTEGAGANTIKQQGIFFAAGPSHDFNASIAANASGEAFVNWSSTNPGIGVNAQVRFSGRQPADPLGVIPAGSVLFQSPTFYRGFGQTSGTTRWGDYSAVSLDPNVSGTCAANRRAWITNQKNNGQTTWGTRIGRIGFC